MASPIDNTTRVQDFGAPASPTSPQPHTNGSPPARLAIDTQLDGQRSRGRSISSTTATAAAPEALLSPDRASIDTLRRRITRSHTVKKYDEYKSPTRPRWEEPGAEPGVDTQNDTDALKYHEHFHTVCQITVVDFSVERIECHELDNDTLEDFLRKPKEDWVVCRWINVNGLSWDVIRMLGNHKSLHRLAIEDLMSDRGRTKVDWYSDQAFCKYIHIHRDFQHLAELTTSSTYDLVQTCSHPSRGLGQQ